MGTGRNGRDLLHHLQPRKPRHQDVEQHDVGLKPLRGRDRALRSARLPTGVEAGSAQRGPQPLAKQFDIVDDEATGLKLFGKTAFYVKEKDGTFKAFLRKPDAEKYAAKSGGAVVGFKEAVASLSS